MRCLAVLALLLPLTACGLVRGPQPAQPEPAVTAPGNTPEMQRLIRSTAQELGIPESLLHRVVRIESGYNPAARNGVHMGLMQINPQTARTMGYEGPAEGLLDPATNLRYGGLYLRGAYIVANGDPDEAWGWYNRGYYYEARDRGLLEETGLRRS